MRWRTIYEGDTNPHRPRDAFILPMFSCSPNSRAGPSLCPNVSGVHLRGFYGDDIYSFIEVWIEGCPAYVHELNHTADLPHGYCLLNSSNVRELLRAHNGGVNLWVQDSLSWNRAGWTTWYNNPKHHSDLKYEYYLTPVDSTVHDNFWGSQRQYYLKAAEAPQLRMEDYDTFRLKYYLRLSRVKWKETAKVYNIGMMYADYGAVYSATIGIAVALLVVVGWGRKAQAKINAPKPESHLEVFCSDCLTTEEHATAAPAGAPALETPGSALPRQARGPVALRVAVNSPTSNDDVSPGLRHATSLSCASGEKMLAYPEGV